MAKGPLGRLLPIYTLDFGVVSLRVHLSKKRDLAAQIAGLESERTELIAQCHEPKAGSELVQHGMKASITPSFDGLNGSFVVTGEPNSDPIAVVRALGRSYTGTFTQDPGDVDDSAGWEVWQLLRRTRVGLEPDTKAPRYETTTESVRLKLTKPPTGDETADFEALTAQVLALKGTLKQGDVVTQAGGESYAVIASPYPEGDFERAELRLREY